MCVSVFLSFLFFFFFFFCMVLVVLVWFSVFNGVSTDPDAYLPESSGKSNGTKLHGPSMLGDGQFWLVLYKIKPTLYEF